MAGDGGFFGGIAYDCCVLWVEVVFVHVVFETVDFGGFVENGCAVAIMGGYVVEIMTALEAFEVGFYFIGDVVGENDTGVCLLYTSPSPRDQRGSRMPSSA